MPIVPESHGSTWASPKPRTSRADAEQALIAAVIELLDTTPIPDITVHKIAEVAGVNFGHINRYFETRLNLFVLVTDTLADKAVIQLRETLDKKIPNTQRPSKEVPTKLLDQVRVSNVAIATKRLRLIQYLLASGVPVERFGSKSRETLDLAVHMGSELGIDPELARAAAIRFIALTWIEASLAPSLGITSEELNNAFLLVPTEQKSTAPSHK